MRRILPLSVLVSLLLPALLAGSPDLLPPSKQLEIRQQWLVKRHGSLLDLMRRHEVDCWIVVNEEFHDDPLTQYLIPPIPVVGNRDVFVLLDTGDDLRKVALTRYADERLEPFFENAAEPKRIEEALPELIDQYEPKAIALSIDGRRGVTRSLSHASYLWLVEMLGPEVEGRFVPATELIEEFLDTRLPEEWEHYRDAVALTRDLGRRALSNEVITPGQTTIGDVRAWLVDRFWEQGVDPWFYPDFRVQRAGSEAGSSRGFLAVAPESTVIERGDLLHVDMGFNYMGLATDWQKMAYVLREGETGPPEGLVKAFQRTRLLQDTLAGVARPGRSAAIVYGETMAEMEEAGVEAQIYSHPLGAQGHALGPSIDFRAADRNFDAQENTLLRPGSYLSIELNTASEIPEWDGKKVWIMQEDPAYLTPEGYRFFVPRQEAFYLIW